MPAKKKNPKYIKKKKGRGETKSMYTKVRVCTEDIRLPLRHLQSEFHKMLHPSIPQNAHTTLILCFGKSLKLHRILTG